MLNTKSINIIIMLVLSVLISGCSQAYNLKQEIFWDDYVGEINKISINDLAVKNTVEITDDICIEKIINNFSNINCRRKKDTIEVSDSENQPIYWIKLYSETSEYWVFVFSNTEFHVEGYRYFSTSSELDVTLFK